MRSRRRSHWARARGCPSRAPRRSTTCSRSALVPHATGRATRRRPAQRALPRARRARGLLRAGVAGRPTARVRLSSADLGAAWQGQAAAFIAWRASPATTATGASTATSSWSWSRCLAAGRLDLGCGEGRLFAPSQAARSPRGRRRSLARDARRAAGGLLGARDPPRRAGAPLLADGSFDRAIALKASLQDVERFRRRDPRGGACSSRAGGSASRSSIRSTGGSVPGRPARQPVHDRRHLTARTTRTASLATGSKSSSSAPTGRWRRTRRRLPGRRAPETIGCTATRGEADMDWFWWLIKWSRSWPGRSLSSTWWGGAVRLTRGQLAALVLIVVIFPVLGMILYFATETVRADARTNRASTGQRRRESGGPAASPRR